MSVGQSAFPFITDSHSSATCDWQSTHAGLLSDNVPKIKGILRTSHPDISCQFTNGHIFHDLSDLLSWLQLLRPHQGFWTFLSHPTCLLYARDAGINCHINIRLEKIKMIISIKVEKVLGILKKNKNKKTQNNFAVVTTDAVVLAAARRHPPGPSSAGTNVHMVIPKEAGLCMCGMFPGTH